MTGMSSRRHIRISRPADAGLRLVEQPEVRRARPWLHHDYRLPVVRELPRRHPDDGVEDTW